MHRRLTRKLRRWGAALLVAAYGFGVVGPALAFAHADRAAVAHVLSETHGGAVTLHLHPDSDGHGHSGTTDHRCCGMSTLAGIAPPAGPIAFRPLASQTYVAPAAAALVGLGAERLERPPR